MKILKKTIGLISLLLVLSIVCGGCDIGGFIANITTTTSTTITYPNEKVDYTADLQEQMKENYIEQFNVENKGAEDVLIEYYAGIYNGFVIAMLDASCHDFEAWTESIGDVEINYPDTNRLLAYKNSTFYTLSEVYEIFQLSKESVEEIAEKFNTDILFFYQICDKYDFGSVAESPPDLSVDADYTTDMVIVRMDEKFSALDQVPPPEYFGSDIIKEVEAGRYSPGSKRMLGLYLHEQTKENVLYVIERLKSIPGVAIVMPNLIYHSEETVPNDTDY